MEKRGSREAREEGLDSRDTWREESAGLGGRLDWGLDWKCYEESLREKEEQG